MSSVICGPYDGSGRAPKRRRVEEPESLFLSLTPQNTFAATNNPGIQSQEDFTQTVNTVVETVEQSSRSQPYTQNGESAESILREGNQSDSQCCYGMLCRIAVRAKYLKSNCVSRIPVIRDTSNRLSTDQDGILELFGYAPDDFTKILNGLVTVEGIEIQLYCSLEDEDIERRQNIKRRAFTSRLYFLNAIIYGPLELANIVGDFLAEHQLYLQDPLGCDRNVLYQNPHNLSRLEGDVIMTDSLKFAPNKIEIEQLGVSPNLLAQLMEGEAPLRETEAPDGLKTSLFSYQKQALSFMLQRERGWTFAEDDMWSKQYDNTGRLSYINNVTGSRHSESPHCFQGGLLADEMGLGKSLSMISLIVANQSCRKSCSSVTISASSVLNASLTPVKTTLLIVPPPLIQTWVDQLEYHLQPGTLTYQIHHGSRKKPLDILKRYDIVITTFQTIAIAWRESENVQRKAKESLFSILWHRIILDEAHIIQNRKSQLATACCALQAKTRWAVTGTPIQNKLTDFASIIKFLQVYPYSDLKKFEDDISKPWRNSNPQGFLRLKTLVKHITISRTKAMIDLPTRTDQIHHLAFHPDERRIYELAKTRTVALLDEAISNPDKRGSTFNALQRLNTLRLLCSHGLLAQGNQAQSLVTAQPPANWSPSEAQKAFDGILWTGVASCSLCEEHLTENFLEDSRSLGSASPRVRISQCLRVFCGSCHAPTTYASCKSGFCDQHYNCSTFEVFFNPSRASLIPNNDVSKNIEMMSTKVKVLVADLQLHQNHEKSVVFSYWTYTLDLVEIMLEKSDIKYTRIDGKTSLPRRAEAVKQFQTDSSCRVILVSISCGGAGLDLTAGSRAYLIEPHWNPMVEEQALCRIHRVGQKRDVTTIRYIMKDSFEEQVVDIQARKKALARETFGQTPLSEAGVNLNTLMYLRAALR